MLDGWVRDLPEGLEGIIRRGYLAVGTFFVLSGFVLAISYASTSWTHRSTARYAAARFARIYPIYAFSLLIVSPFILAERLPWTGGPLLSSKAGLLADYIFLLLGWTGWLPVNWNTPAWSLSCEAFFYLCFPLAAAWVCRAGWRGVAAAGAAACLWPAVIVLLRVPDMWKPLVHLSDFLIGMAAARAYLLLEEWSGRAAGRGYRLYLPCCGVGLLLIAYPHVLGGVISLSDALRPLHAGLLIGFALGGGLVARALSTAPAVYLGKASYALYILHVPVLWWYKRAGHRLFGRMPDVPAAFLYVGLVVAVSAGVYGALEEPANRRLRDWLGKLL